LTLSQSVENSVRL